MIELFAIVNEGTPIETYTRGKNKKLKAMLNLFLREIKNSQSRFIQQNAINNYQVYFFWQDNFLFLLATQISTRSQRMKNYLRIVADIFYENYDERKFHIVLNRIMDEINKTQFGAKKSQTVSLEDEEMGLVTSHLQTSKQKIHQFIEEKQKKSRRAFIISLFLFVVIVFLAIYDVITKW